MKKFFLVFHPRWTSLGLVFSLVVAGVAIGVFAYKNHQGVGSVTSRAQDGCKISGCSAQICAEDEQASDCMYREEYMCYQKAICKKQQNGKCGWTETPEITACIKQFTE